MYHAGQNGAYERAVFAGQFDPQKLAKTRSLGQDETHAAKVGQVPLTSVVQMGGAAPLVTRLHRARSLAG